MSIIKNMIKGVASWIGKRNPELITRIRYRMRFHRRLDLENPSTLNEKIQYMSLRTDTTEWSRLADKYAVREYVSNCGLESILNKLYGVWDDASDIDFDSLPDQFILKTTNGSGYCIIVEDKNAIDREQIKDSLRKMLKTVYGLSEGNPHYSRIKPRVIAEELLVNDPVSAQYSRSIIDYKVWCFNGKACFIWVCTDRTHAGTDVLVYDTQWNAHPEYSRVTPYYRQGSPIPKPENFEYMLSVAEKLAAPFPVVRVDLYNIAGRVLFGELTFTAVGGLMNCYTDSFLKMTGDMIRLPGRSVEN
jgi:hypothetical protein